MASDHVILGERPEDSVLISLHYAFPIAVFAYYITATSISICTLHTKRSESRDGLRRLAISSLLAAILSYLGQLLTIVIYSLINGQTPGTQDTIISLLSCVLVFGVQFVGIIDKAKPVWYPYIGSIGIAITLEPVTQIFRLLTRKHESWGLAPLDVFELATASARWLVLMAPVVVYLWDAFVHRKEKATDVERQPLLNKNDGEANGNFTTNGATNGHRTGYGSTSENSEAATDASRSALADTTETPWQKREREAKEMMEKRLKENGNWFAYARRFTIFIPYIWPTKNKPLQIRLFLVGLCLLVTNFVNLLIPRQLGLVMDSLSGASYNNPWLQVLYFIGLRLLASESGLKLLRSWLWAPVEYYSFEALSTAAYSHVLHLSSDFHDTKSSSDIMMAIQSGQSVSNMLDSICFQAIPMLVDMTVAFVYLSVKFGPYEGFVTIATGTVFICVASRMISGLKSARRGEVSAWYEEHYVRQAGIQGWSTVTSFNQVNHEEQRYSTAVKNRVTIGQTVYIGYLVAFAVQFLILLCGLLAGAFLAVYQVAHLQATAGDFIMLLTYWAQLVAPLNFFSNLGKSVTRDLIGSEQLLEIMQTKPTVTTKEGAEPLEFRGGHVRFRGVCFSYDGKKHIIKDVDFDVGPGMTVAFVGSTGAGKSTILKLLDRFYDVTAGSITIDGQDVRDVDLSSLRGQIGVVPQNPILFDDTIMNNVRYANLAASDEEVYEACRAASIHDQILGFAESYETRVGERGVKLSGGEIQRIAIARAILKKPAIVMLDEATSAVDTDTEQKIQEALGTLCHGRTTFVVAHRLSTIMNADRIIVVGGGKVIEEGTHDELLLAKGKYADLWSKQAFRQNRQSGKEGDGDDEDDSSAGTPPKKMVVINDLTDQDVSSEIARAQKARNQSSAVLLDHKSDSQITKDTNGADGGAHETPARCKGGESKESARLNPDAPSFTPRSLIATTPGATISAYSPTRSRSSRAGCCRSRDSFYGGKTTPTPTPALSPSVAQTIQPAPPVQYFAAPIYMVPASYLYPPAATSQQIKTSQNRSSDGTSPGHTVAHSSRVTVASIPSEPSAVFGRRHPNPGGNSVASLSSSLAPSCSPPRAADGNRSNPEETAAAQLMHPRYSRRIQSKSEPSGGNSSSNKSSP